jgi:DNA repair exonuclease SbcCD ATPase subunit
MKVLNVTAENLLSFKDLSLDFKDSGLVLVEGWNYDDGRANGAGKTAIFDLLSLALYEKMPRKITATETLKDGEKKGYVEASVRKGDDVYTAVYARPKNRSFKKNDEPIDITQAEFESIIGLTYDQFLVSMYTSQTASKKFFMLNDSGKKDFLLDLMDLSKFLHGRKAAESKIKDIRLALTDLISKKDKAKSKIEAYLEYEVDENKIVNDIDAHAKDIKAFNKEIIKLQEVEKPDLSKFYDLENKLIDKQSNFISLRAQRRGLSDQFLQLQSGISDFTPSAPDAHCPSCATALRIRGSSVAQLEDTDALKAQHEKHMQHIKDQMLQVKVKIDAIDSELSEESSIKVLRDKIRQKRDKQSERYNAAVSSIRELQGSVKNKNNAILKLQNELQQAQDIKEKTQTLQELVLKIDNQLDKLSVQENIYSTISQAFSPTGAPAYVLDSIVNSFNEAVNEHITMIWASASYELQSHKESAKGDITAKFSEILIINGKQRSIGALSGGEGRAFSLAIDFAIIDLLGKQFGMPLNPIIMDEPFEGLDAIGREVVIELLEKLAVDRQIWVIDHASESKSMFSDIVRVEKTNGTSKIALT